MAAKQGDPFNDASGGLDRSFRSTARTFLAYAEARAQLFALEAREASQILSGRAFYLLVGGGLLLLGYVLFLTAAVSMLAQRLELHWHWICLAFAGIHLLPGAVLLAMCRRRFTQPLFDATLAEFDKDRAWLNPSKKKKPS